MFLNIAERVKLEKYFKMTLFLSQNISYAYLLRAAPYMLLFELHKDALFRCKKPNKNVMNSIVEEMSYNKCNHNVLLRFQQL